MVSKLLVVHHSSQRDNFLSNIYVINPRNYVVSRVLFCAENCLFGDGSRQVGRLITLSNILSPLRNMNMKPSKKLCLSNLRPCRYPHRAHDRRGRDRSALSRHRARGREGCAHGRHGLRARQSAGVGSRHEPGHRERHGA